MKLSLQDDGPSQVADEDDTSGIGSILAAVFTGGLSTAAVGIANAVRQHPLEEQWRVRYGNRFWHHPDWRRAWRDRFGGVEYTEHPAWRRYGRTALRFREAAGLDGDTSGTRRYSAMEGDTPQAIASQFGALKRPMWAAELKAANPGRVWTHLYSGDEINIPDEWAPGADASGPERRGGHPDGRHPGRFRSVGGRVFDFDTPLGRADYERAKREREDARRERERAEGDGRRPHRRQEAMGLDGDTSGAARRYSAMEGDTPQAIASQFGALKRPTWAAELKAANPGRVWTHLYSGDAINIPDEWAGPGALDTGDLLGDLSGLLGGGGMQSIVQQAIAFAASNPAIVQSVVRAAVQNPAIVDAVISDPATVQALVAAASRNPRAVQAFVRAGVMNPQILGAVATMLGGR